jgi:hypothetical protein
MILAHERLSVVSQLQDRTACHLTFLSIWCKRNRVWFSWSGFIIIAFRFKLTSGCPCLLRLIIRIIINNTIKTRQADQPLDALTHLVDLSRNDARQDLDNSISRIAEVLDVRALQDVRIELLQSPPEPVGSDGLRCGRQLSPRGDRVGKLIEGRRDFLRGLAGGFDQLGQVQHPLASVRGVAVVLDVKPVSRPRLRRVGYQRDVVEQPVFDR